MADLITFVPRADLDAQANLAGFIDLCRTQLKIFGESLPFAEDRWDVSSAVELKGRACPPRLVFSSFATCDDNEPFMMREPFKSFAKAYLRYTCGTQPTQAMSMRMRALRALEAALCEAGTADPVQTTAHALNRAAQMVGERHAPNTAYNTGIRLEALSNFLCDNGLIAVPTRWRSPVKKPKNQNKVGKDGDEHRAKKMPSQAALNALPGIFRLATNAADVLVSSATAILCSAPDRINEVLLLPVNCEVRKKWKDSGEDVYGLRWWPAKGAEPMVKWMIPSMAGVVEEAVGKIRRLTEEARAVARWYEESPDQLYLPSDLEHLRAQEWLSMPDVKDILFADPVGATVAPRWCSDNAIPSERRGNRKYVRFADVESALLKMLPHGFPFVHAGIGLKYSDALFVVQRNALHALKARFRCVIEPVTHEDMYARLGSRSTTGILSIFDRYGFHEPDGGPIRVNTHQFRHYLNTLAQAGGMSQLDIAKWSGRKNVQQNKYYDHETPTAIVARIRAALGDDTRMFGPLAARPRATLIARDEFARLKIPTAHTTDFGYCIHDYVMSPCQLHRDCLNCGEQVCIKGESQKEMRIRQAHDEATRLLAMAEQADADGEIGASEWAEHHRTKLARISALLDLLDNPAVPRGAFIQLLPADMPSRLEQAAQARALLPSPVVGDSSPNFEEVA